MNTRKRSTSASSTPARAARKLRAVSDETAFVEKKKARAPKKQVKTARPFIPENASLDKLRQASKKCEGCDLYKYATQTVFGEGAADAKIVFVGEQPGDKEDRSGRPFTGPAGKMLDKALNAAGIDREDVYFTNAVKHFGFQQRGKGRLHKKPRVIEVNACFPWLEEELKRIQPQIIVCLGATAIRAVLGPGVKVMENRGKLLPSRLAPYVMPTIHPSSILRAPDHDARERQMGLLVEDMRKVAELVVEQ